MMLQAPTNDRKTQTKPHSPASPKTAEQLPEQQNNLAALQKTYGNQAVLRMIRRSPAANPVQGVLQRKCACGNSAGSSGSCAECQSKQEGILQTKLQIGEVGDRYEQEADRVAEKIMTMPDPATAQSMQRGIAPEKEEYIQTKSLATSITPMLGKGTDFVQSKSRPQGLETGSSFDAGQPLENRLNNSGSGSPLSHDVRAFMEPRFGVDFSQVRVHTGSEAVQMNQDLNAQAFTHQQDVYFGVGKAPAKDTLTAHELTHVVQQEGDLGGNYLQRQDDIISKDSEFMLGDQLNQEDEEDEDEDIEDGDTEVPDLDATPDFDIQPHSPEPFATLGDISQPIELSDDGTLGPLPTSKIKHIDVDQVSQLMKISFVDKSPPISHRISTGRGECGTVNDPCKTQSEHHCTPNGTFLTVSRGNANTKNSKGDAMAWFVGLRVPGRTGIGIHNSQIAPGTPRSHGCVRTGKGTESEQFAKFINKQVRIGKTDVTISGKAKTVPYPCPKNKRKKKP